MWKYILLAVIIVIAIILIVYSSSSSSSAAPESLIYDGLTVYTSSGSLVYSSDGVSYIYYATPNGAYAYNVKTKKKTKITSNEVTGMAFDTDTNKLLMISGGILSSSDPDGSNYSNNISSGVTMLYDTIDGYYMSSGNNYAMFGTSKLKNTGDYGIIDFTVSKG